MAASDHRARRRWREIPTLSSFLQLLLLSLLSTSYAIRTSRDPAMLISHMRSHAMNRMEELGVGCPPPGTLLPCVCLVRGGQVHVTCENSELDKIVVAMETLMKNVHHVEELTLMGNRIPVLPGRIFGSLQITKLFLINNELMGITRNAFAGLESSLQHLYLKDPGLYDVPFDTLDNLANLRTCVLEDTDIVEIPRLYSLSKLEFLKIDGSRVSSIPSAAFRFMPNMKKVHISNSLLKEVKGNALEGLVYLKEVNFSNNIIDWIHPRAFRTLNAVEHLSLAGNNLSDAGMAVLAAREMRELRILDMSGNQLVKLVKGTFVDMPNVRTINLSDNIISEVEHGAFFRLPAFRTLDISGNLLSEFHADIFTESSNLEHLSVARNNLSFVAEMRYIARSLPNLRSLDISENLLKMENPKAFHGHPNLEALKIDKNKIQTLQAETFNDLPNLRELYLGHNHIQSNSNGQVWDLPKLRVLDLSHNELKKVDYAFLEGLPTLSIVDLSFNLITDVGADAFQGSPLVKNLNMSYNSIALLPDSVFQVLEGLFELELSFNELTALRASLFKGLNRLEHLHLTHNQIMAVDADTFKDAGSLRFLDLSANFIQELPVDALSNLASLRVLKLHRNAISNVNDGYLSGLKGVEHLDLSSNHIQVLSHMAFADMAHLRDVDLSVNYLQSLHQETFAATRVLEKLNVSHNYLSSVGHEAFSSLKRLRILDLTNNSLTELGDTVVDLPALQALFLSENYISSLRNLSFADLPSLSVLHFKNNGLQTFETMTFHSLPSLVYLDLRGNNLVELNPDAFRNLPSLQEMQVSKNQISVVKDFAFSDLPALRSLELQDNVITEVGGRAFYNLPAIKFLNLSRNGLQDVPEEALGRLTSLDVLDLSWNYILEIQDSSFYRLEWLTVLMMHDNDLCRMSPGSFARQRALRVLTLHNNQLKRLHLHALGNTIKGLSLLDMSGNPFQCDCEMVWLREYLMEPPEPGRAQRTSILGDSLKGIPVCAAPDEYKGMPITEVPVTAFLCGARRSPGEVDDICVPRFLDPLLFTGGRPGGLDPGAINTLLYLTNLTEAIPQADTGPSYLDYNNPIHVPSAPGLVALSSVIDDELSTSSTSTTTTAAVSTAEVSVATPPPTESQISRNQSEQLIASSNIHTVTGDTPTIYAGSAGHTEDIKQQEQQESGIFSGLKLPTLPNIIESISNLNLPQLGLNVNWGNFPIIGRQDSGFLGKTGPLPDTLGGKPMKGPDTSEPIWVDGPSSPHPLFPNPPSPPPAEDLPPPLEANPSRGPHPVSGETFVFPTSPGDRRRPGVPGVVIPVTRPSNIWAPRPHEEPPNVPRPGQVQGPQLSGFSPGNSVLPSVPYVGPGPNSGVPFLPGLSSKQDGRRRPGGQPSAHDLPPPKASAPLPFTPPPIPQKSSPSGQDRGTTWSGTFWSQPEVINPDSGVSLYQPREPFQPYQPEDPNHPITVVDAPNMSAERGASSTRRTPTSPLVPMGPPSHTSPAPPDMSPSETQVVADGGNLVLDTDRSQESHPDGNPLRQPDGLPPFSDDSGRRPESQEVGDASHDFQRPDIPQGHEILIDDQSQEIPFIHGQPIPKDIHEQHIPIIHQEIPASHGQEVPFIHQEIPVRNEDHPRPPVIHGHEVPITHQEVPTRNQEHIILNEDLGSEVHIDNNSPDSEVRLPVGPSQPIPGAPVQPTGPTGTPPDSQGPSPPQQSLSDLINLLYAAEAEIQGETRDEASPPLSVSRDENDPLEEPSFDSTLHDPAASASAPEAGFPINQEASTPETTTTTHHPTTSRISTTTTTTTTTRTVSATDDKQDHPPQLGEGVTVVKDGPPVVRDGPPRPDRFPTTEQRPIRRPPRPDIRPVPSLPDQPPTISDGAPPSSTSRYRPGIILPVDKSGDPLPGGVRTRVPPNNTQISPSRSIGRGGVPTIERVEQPSHREHDSEGFTVQGIDLPRGDDKDDVDPTIHPAIPNAEFETNEVNAIDWYYSNYFREYDPYANLPVGGNKPENGASTVCGTRSALMICVVTLFLHWL